MDGSAFICDHVRTDETAPVRGIVNGLLVALVLWAIIAVGLILLLA